MKCIKSNENDIITRVSNKEADSKVNIKQSHIYATKKEWKEKVRDINKKDSK